MVKLSSIPSQPVSETDAIYYETVGRRDKFWFDDENNQRCMFKQNFTDNEDWPEIVVGEIAAALGMPHASYCFAHLVDSEGAAIAGGDGVVTASFVGKGQSLTLGNTLLSGFDQEYATEVNNYKVKKHTIEAISQAIANLEPPLEAAMHDINSTALEFYAGYLFLDVLVANQDRHHENWGSINHQNHHYLAPTFDHASSFARNVSDAIKQQRMETRDRGFSVEFFAQKAKSAINVSSESRQTLTTRAALTAFCRHNGIGVTMWQNQLRNLSGHQLSAIINRIPEKYMSGITKEFTLRLLHVNKCYLLDL